MPNIQLENCGSMTSYVTPIIETNQLTGTGFNFIDELVGFVLLTTKEDIKTKSLIKMIQ